jgi:hypothetical protein
LFEQPIIQPTPIFSPLVQQVPRPYVQPTQATFAPSPAQAMEQGLTFDQQMQLLDRKIQLEDRRASLPHKPVSQDYNRNLPKLPTPGLFDGNAKGIPTFISSIKVYFNTLAQVGEPAPEHWKVSFTGSLLTYEYVLLEF